MDNGPTEANIAVHVYIANIASLNIAFSAIHRTNENGRIESSRSEDMTAESNEAKGHNI